MDALTIALPKLPFVNPSFTLRIKKEAYSPALEGLSQHADHPEPGEDAGEEAVRQSVLAAAQEGTAGLLQLFL